MLSTQRNCLTDRNKSGNVSCNAAVAKNLHLYLKMTFTLTSSSFLLTDHTGHEITWFARPHYSYIKPTGIHMLRSLLTNIQFWFFSSEKAAMSNGWGSTFLLLELYYRIIVSYKRLRLGLSSKKDLWVFFAPITTSSLLFKLNIKYVKYRKNLQSLKWNPGLVQSLQVFRPLLDKYLRALLPYSGTVLLW